LIYVKGNKAGFYNPRNNPKKKLTFKKKPFNLHYNQSEKNAGNSISTKGKGYRPKFFPNKTLINNNKSKISIFMNMYKWKFNNNINYWFFNCNNYNNNNNNLNYIDIQGKNNEIKTINKPNIEQIDFSFQNEEPFENEISDNENSVNSNIVNLTQNK